MGNLHRAAAIAVAAFGLALFGVPANSAIIDIAATDDVGTQVSFTQGTTSKTGITPS